MRFPYGCICRKNFFDKTETTDTTYTTIWKPRFNYINGELICYFPEAKLGGGGG